MRTVIVVAALLVAFLVGVNVGGRTHIKGIGGTSTGIDVEHGSPSKSDEVNLDAVRRLIEQKYFVKVPASKLVNASIGGMVKSLPDRFSHYITPAQSAAFEQILTGNYSGVGMAVDSNKQGLLVQKVYAHTPAAGADVRAGDVVVAVNGKSTKGESADVVVAKIKGKEGTKVRLTMRRPVKSGSARLGPPRSIVLTRKSIALPIAASQVKTVDGKKIGHIELASFTGNSTKAVAAQVVKLISGCPRSQGGASIKGKACVQGIVFDLRGDGGGRLDQAVGVGSIFIEHGTIVATQGRASPRQTYKATGDALVPDMPLVVLVDKGSASASEIVSGAVKYNGRGKLVGTRTFGKGTFQEVTKLANGGELALTIGRFYTAGTHPIPPHGLKPDIYVPLAKVTPKRDPALTKALDVVASEIK